jgi:NAD(P)-dependent dehydrogenase (short-subunit alcohol dehydrogenase family)
MKENKSMTLLSGRSVAITGAGRGIGAAVATLCAELGADVVVNDLGVGLGGEQPSSSPGQEVVRQIVEAGGRAVLNTEDVATIEGGRSVVESAIASFGKLDVLINCAGILRDRMIFNMSEEDWDAVIRVHLRGHYSTARAAAQYWRDQHNPDGNYRLINFTSGAGLFGGAGQPNYAAAKMGVVGLTYSCANALRKYGVTTNAIAPAAETRMTGSVPDERRRYRKDGDERHPRNVAPIVAYLASEASRWCNGQVIGAVGYSVTLFNRPSALRQLVSTGPWDVEQLGELVESVFKPATEGAPR